MEKKKTIKDKSELKEILKKFIKFVDIHSRFDEKCRDDIVEEFMNINDEN